MISSHLVSQRQSCYPQVSAECRTEVWCVVESIHHDSIGIWHNEKHFPEQGHCLNQTDNL